MKTRTRHVVCWLEPYFNIVDVSAFCQVLSIAGSNWNWRPYRLSLASEAGGLVTSRAQVCVDTVRLASCDAPDVVILAGGEANTVLTATSSPFTSWQHDGVWWVALRDAVPTLLQLGVAVSTLAVGVAHQTRVRQLHPQVQFSAKDFHIDGQVLSCATLDVLPAALALLERQIGQSARRYVETQMGLTQTAIDLQGFDKLRP